jgi:hypothetical protein
MTPPAPGAARTGIMKRGMRLRLHVCLATTCLAAGLATGCGSAQRGLSTANAGTLRSQLAAVASAAARGDRAGALAALSAVNADVSRDGPRLSSAERSALQTGIARVRSRILTTVPAVATQTSATATTPAAATTTSAAATPPAPTTTAAPPGTGPAGTGPGGTGPGGTGPGGQGPPGHDHGGGGGHGGGDGGGAGGDGGGDGGGGGD